MKQFKLPFMGQLVTVKVLPPRAMSIPDLLGEFLLDTHEIHLSANLPVSARRAVLSHELFHAYLGYSGHNELLEIVSPNFEEALTRGFEHAIGSMIYYPPKIEAWLNGDT